MEVLQSLRFVKSNESKRIFTGQRHIDVYPKLFHLAFVLTLSFMTAGIWLLLNIFMKKSQFHPDIYIKNTNNPIDTIKPSKLVEKAGYELPTSEDPLIFINIKSDQFLLITDSHIYYTMSNSTKLMDTQSTSGKLPISAAKDIKSKKNSMYDSLSVMFDGEVVGVLDNAQDPRVIGLLREFSKDVREQI
jgi:hypothetical protein|tara:strand:+ start:182 stop:748 length:567 start_codon:yes stop_codon:yes gene_type:complete